MFKKRTVNPSHKQTSHYVPKQIQQEYARKAGGLKLNYKGFLIKGSIVKIKFSAGPVLQATANGHGSIRNLNLKTWICGLSEGGKTKINVTLVEDQSHKFILEFTSDDVP